MFDLAIAAHDSKKEEVMNLIEKFRHGIAGLSMVATMNTGIMIKQMMGIYACLL